jgi:hypothetical protein
MTVQKIVLKSLMFCVLALTLVGCGGGTSSATSATNTETANDVAEMLLEYNEAKKAGPASLADLDKTDASATHPLGHAAVARQDFIVFWRTVINPSNAEIVLAYEKDAGAKGGAVIMGDGKVKAMTADEFSAAKKASTVKK